jgi:hypothetical protein
LVYIILVFKRKSSYLLIKLGMVVAIYGITKLMASADFDVGKFFTLEVGPPSPARGRVVKPRVVPVSTGDRNYAKNGSPLRLNLGALLHT